MATTAVNLSVPAAAEDSMDMTSSPGIQHDLDQDIDFEFDDYAAEGNNTNVNDDDRMTDDGDTRPATATDDVMEDDMQHDEQIAVQEEEMQDSPSHVQQEEDEELIDYSDDEPQDELVEDAITTDAPEQAPAAAPVVGLQKEDVDEEVARPVTGVAVERPTEDTTQPAAVVEETVAPLPTEDATTAELVEQDDTAAADADQFEQVAVDEAHGDEFEEHEHAADEEHVYAEDEEHFATENAEAAGPAISLDTDVPPTVDGPATPTDTGLHAMTVRYGGFHFPLFRSRNQPEGLLKNDNLASLSLGELMQNCRQRLAFMTCENISEDQDLVLAFDQLGLILNEGSRAAFECSLDEVLNVFLQLHQNDGAEEIPPFSMTLSLQLKFTSSISVLKHAAANGEGISHFGVLHPGEAEEEAEEYPDQYADADAEYGNQEGEAYEEQYYEHDVNGVGYEEEGYNQGAEQGFDEEADTNDYHEYHQDQETAYQGQDEYHQDEQQDDQQDYYEGQDEDQYYDEQPDEAAQLLDEHALEGDGLLEGSGGAVLITPEDQTAAPEEAAQETQETTEEEKNASTATSITLQGDDGLDTTGEYTDEDYIDWDDLTSDPSEQSNGGNLDSSTLLQGDGDDTQNTSLTADQQQPETTVHSAEKTLEDGPEEDNAATTQTGQAQQNLASEDFLGEFGEQYNHDDTTQQTDHDPAHATEEQQEEHGQAHNQTDDPTQQQEDPTHPDNLPAEDEEHFQTAYELFDGEEDANDNITPPINGKQQDPQPQQPTNTTPQDPNEDFIDFGDDDDVEPAPAPAVSTPKAKRSYEDLVGGEDEIDFESPEPKKSKTS